MRPITLLKRLLVIGALALLLTPPSPVGVAHALSILPLPAPRRAAPTLGYQLATDAGDVLPYGAAVAGFTDALPSPVTGVARTATGAGAWTVTADGGVITTGDAAFFGSLGGQKLMAKVVGITGTPTGRGYWLASADGGVFAFGDAGFFGSVVGAKLRAPIVSVLATPSGLGYWLASGDGGVFTFGDARFFGSAVNDHLRGWISSMAASPSGNGYWLAAVDGGVFAYGDATFLGRPASGDLRAPVVGLAASRSGKGYWVVAADGGVFTFGDAPFLGAGTGKVYGRVVGIAAGAGRSVPKEAQQLPARLRNAYGNDISWPQCDQPLPARGYGFGIVGISGGAPFTRNKCLAREWAWATAGGTPAAVYTNLAGAVPGGPAEMRGPAGDCSIKDLPCQTYNQAANTIGDALAWARANGVDAPFWWLDVETLNRWSPNKGLNALTVKAAVETLAKSGIKAGVYSSPDMWKVVTGGERNGLPVWLAAIVTDDGAPALCNDARSDFTGGGVRLVQSVPVQFDVNYACAPTTKDPASFFRTAG